MYIAGVLLRARPEQLDQISHQALQLSGVDVHARTTDGRLVVTIEGDNRRQIADTIFKLDSLDHVLSSSMVYEESETDFQQLEMSQ